MALPVIDGYALSAGARGRCISCTILWRQAPIVEIAVAGHSRCGSALWRDLHAMAGRLGLPIATQADRCPPEPWCAVLLYHSADHHRELIPVLADLERCIAWTWLEIRRG